MVKADTATNAYLKDELKTAFLEVLGQSYLNTQLSPYKQTQVYGALGVIWRENIYHMLIDEEDAIPFNALYMQVIRMVYHSLKLD